MVVFLKLACICDGAVYYEHNLYFRDGLARNSSAIYALVETRIEPLEGLVRVEGFPQIRVVCREVHGQYPGVMAIDMDEQEDYFRAGVSRKHVLEGGEVSVLEGR